MRRHNVARMAYRHLEPRVQIFLIGLFLVCFAGGLALVQVFSSMRWALVLMALPFLGQAAVFGAIRFHPPLAKRLSRGTLDRTFAFLFAFVSALLVVALLFFAMLSQDGGAP